jgi:hypothetical protein
VCVSTAGGAQSTLDNFAPIALSTGFSTLVTVGSFKQLIMLHARVNVFLLHIWEPLQHFRQIFGDLIAKMQALYLRQLPRQSYGMLKDAS